nr:hypothetical protein [Gammaproteobacteria bacterium]NIY10056.1 hypothetical protein [Gemmatimonadota bacterium]
MANRAAGMERDPVGRPAARPAPAWERLLVATLGGVVGGWLIVDGIRAMVTGDYATPSGGPYAGQLGPWAALVESVGLDPRSILVMGLHVVTG